MNFLEKIAADIVKEVNENKNEPSMLQEPAEKLEHLKVRYTVETEFPELADALKANKHLKRATVRFVSFHDPALEMNTKSNRHVYIDAGNESALRDWDPVKPYFCEITHKGEVEATYEHLDLDELKKIIGDL